MSAETDFVTLMKATSAVTAIIGSGGNARVSENRIEQDDELPAMIFARTETDNATAFDGTILDSKATLEVQCWADTPAAASALADAVQTAVTGAQQFVIGKSVGAEEDGDKACTTLVIDWWA